MNIEVLLSRLSKTLTPPAGKVEAVRHRAAALAFIFFAVAVALAFLGSGDLAGRRFCAPCEDQELTRELRLEGARNRQAAAEKRIEIFERALTADAYNPLFLTATQQLTTEEAARAGAKRLARQVEIPTKRQSLPRMLATLVLLVLAVGLAARAARRIKERAETVDADFARSLATGGHAATWWIAVTAWLFSTTAGVYTNILVEDRSWFTWDDFCISPGPWIVLRLTDAALALVVAHPVAMLWAAARPEGIPTTEDAFHRPSWAREYLALLRSWAIWCLLALVAIAVPWIAWVATREPEAGPFLVRLLSAAGLVGPVLLVTGRLIRNAFVIRRRLEDSLHPPPAPPAPAAEKTPTGPAFWGS